MKATAVYTAVVQLCSYPAVIGRYRADWIDRFTRRIMEASDISEEVARQCAEQAAEMNAEFADMDWEDPIEAADEELSYWGD